MDLISRSVLIEALEKRKRKATAFSDVDWNSALKVCIDTVKEQPKVGEWIPCSERLPERDVEAVVKQIEELKDQFHGGTLQEHYFKIALETAIEIIRRGGVSNG